MTRERRDNGGTPFGAWLRNHPALKSRYGYDAEDMDYWWHQYLAGRLMLMEEKRFDAEPTYAQKDTLGIIDQALRFAFHHPDFCVKRLNHHRPARLQYYGYHLIQFECNTPEDGGISVDGIPLSTESFLRFLQFDDKTHRSLRVRQILNDVSSKITMIGEHENIDRSHKQVDEILEDLDEEDLSWWIEEMRGSK